MPDRNQLKNRARDELFSHINRCGVLQAVHEEQGQWLDETMGYLAERFPDLGEADLRELHTLGLRFCQPAIQHRKDMSDGEGDEGETVTAGAEDTSAG